MRLEEHFVENATLSDNYFIADCEEIMKVAALIDELPLGLHDKYLFCISPVDLSDDISSQGLTQFAQNYAKRDIVPLREIFTPGTLQIPKTPGALKELESIQKVLDLYVWLSFRLEESFPDRELASSQKSICHLLIEEFLERFGLQKQRPKAKRLASNTTLTSLLSQKNIAYL
ncbi:putative RNA helicase [Rosa chinensis]|uniref:Putative RNA helicase n=1 Tax=Rosa chinensis TaxID=74649 RepID=A0A2P6S961_ROSCH|nr:putative RNA helicase [Rosa chinensis]